MDFFLQKSMGNVYSTTPDGIAGIGYHQPL